MPMYATAPHPAELRFSSGFKIGPDAFYLLLATSYFGICIYYYLFNSFGFENAGRDTWHHVAVLRELMASPFDPSNPHISTDEPSRYFSPLNVIAAMFGKFFGGDAFQLYGIMGALSCVGLLVASRDFALRYFKSPWAPPIFLTLFLFGWGSQQGFTGYHNFASFLSSAAYPATQTLILSIFGWSLTLAILDSKEYRPVKYAGLILLTAFIVLAHQFSAFIGFLGLGSFVLFHATADLKTRALTLASVFAGGLLSLMWPLYDPLIIILNSTDPLWNPEGAIVVSVAYMAQVMLPAPVGIAGMKKIGFKGWRWELILPAAFLTCLFVILHTVESPIAHRMPPAIMLYLQVAATWAFLALIGRKMPVYIPAGLIVVVILAMIYSVQIAVKPRLDEFKWRKSQGALLDATLALEKEIAFPHVSFASDNVVYPLQATGHKVVSIPRPEPAAKSLVMRQQATRIFFERGTTNIQRLQMMKKWNATYIVFRKTKKKADVSNEIMKLGPSKAFARRIVLVKVGK